MNYNYEQSIQICEEALDLMNVKNFLEDNEEVKIIMNNIEESYNAYPHCSKNVTNFMLQYPEIFGKDDPQLFNYMNQDEFINYCEKRYPNIHWGYETIERYWVINHG